MSRRWPILAGVVIGAFLLGNQMESLINGSRFVIARSDIDAQTHGVFSDLVEAYGSPVLVDLDNEEYKIHTGPPFMRTQWILRYDPFTGAPLAMGTRSEEYYPVDRALIQWIESRFSGPPRTLSEVVAVLGEPSRALRSADVVTYHFDTLSPTTQVLATDESGRLSLSYGGKRKVPER